MSLLLMETAVLQHKAMRCITFWNTGLAFGLSSSVKVFIISFVLRKWTEEQSDNWKPWNVPYKETKQQAMINQMKRWNWNILKDIFSNYFCTKACTYGCKNFVFYTFCSVKGRKATKWCLYFQRLGWTKV